MTGSLRTSVVVPVRNGQRFVAEAVRSILAQLGEDDEIFVVDDGSDDETAAIVEAFANRRVRLLQADGRGVSAARNQGIGVAQGPLVAFLDHDDLWPEGRHAVLTAHMADNPADAAVYGRVRIRIEDDAVDAARSQALDGKHIIGLVGSGLYRLDAVRAIGGFDDSMRMAEDSDFQFRFEARSPRYTLHPSDALVYRRHGGNVTNDEAAVRRSLLNLARRKLARERGAGAETA